MDFDHKNVTEQYHIYSQNKEYSNFFIF